jgi:single-strand DNA-binding protein
MNETVITLQGNLGNDVTVREAGGVSVATFRVACTPRRYRKKTDDWVDGDTQWFTVNAWRGLAESCAQSLHRGDPVFVRGRLNAQVWTNGAGVEVTTFEVEAQVVGHDLTRGTSVFTRTPRAGDSQGEPRSEARDDDEVGSPTEPAAA